MMSAFPAQLILKEARALAPIWIAAAASIVAGALTGAPGPGILAFVLGTIALGAFSIGHEYMHRTLPSLLAQPVTRSRLLLSKLAVLAPCLILLSLVAALTVFRVDGLDRAFGNGTTGARWRLALIILTPALGLCVAPYMTLLCRSGFAGLVFTLAVPAGLWITAELTRVATVGFDIYTADYALTLPLMTAGVLVVTAVAVAHGRALFMRVEALDGGRDVVPRALTPAAGAAAGPSRRRHPVALLLVKEVRLHGLAYAIALLYAVGWIALSLAGTDAYVAGQSFIAITQFYGVFIAMLIGAVASAEERAMGTFEWQVLLPQAVWKQWTVKLLSVAALTVVLGLVVPIVLEAAFPLIRDSGAAGLRRLGLPFGVGRGPQPILLVAIVSFYVSTLCVGGLRALVVTLPLAFGLAALYTNLIYATSRLEYDLLYGMYGESARRLPLWWQQLSTATGDDLMIRGVVARWLPPLLFSGFILLLLAWSLRNSRSAERGGVKATRQLPWIVAYVALAGVLVYGAPSLLGWWLLTH